MLPGRGRGGDFCDAHAINERGEIVGISRTPSGELHGFLWRDGAFSDVGPVDLPGETTQTSTDSAPLDINEHELAVGYASPGMDVLTYRWGEGGRVLTYFAAITAPAVNDWSTIFALAESTERLLLMEPSGWTTDKGVLTGGVNGQALFANNQYQIAWQSSNLKGYFCQLGR